MSLQRRPWLIGWEAAKANAAPAFVLQSMMLAILLAYYFHPPSAALLNALADFNQRHGLALVLIATWAVWIPLMAVIYSLPLALQFPLFALALAFWVLMMTYMTNRFAGKIEADGELPISVVGDVRALKR